MIRALIKEIDICLDNECYMAALTTALTLPDICGKAKYPELSTSKRYVQWFDDYIGQYERSPLDCEEMPCLNGELVYSLRCFLLHQGSPSVDEAKMNIDYFELQYNKQVGMVMSGGVATVEFERINGKDIAVSRKISVNIRTLCWKLCRLASVYYEKNKEKFSFINYNMVDCDFHTRKIFGLNKS